MTKIPHAMSRFGSRIAASFERWIERIAERRMRQVQFELRMYEGLYRHSSKNDDDLPIAR